MTKKEAIRKYKKKHPEASTREIAKALSCGMRTVQNALQNTQYDVGNLVKYLSRGHTMEEIKKKFQKNELQIKQIMPESYKDLELFVSKNNFGEAIYVYLPKSKDLPKPEEREWKYAKQPDGQPYLQIQFNKLDDNVIKICPLSDVHVGHVAHLADKFNEYVEFIANTPNVYTFINGDLWEFANKLSIGSGVYEQNLMPDEQIQATRDILIRLKHKILWAIPGNHEERTMKSVGVDVLRTLCEAIEIPYYNEPIYVDLLWRGNKFTVYAQHGSSGSGTKGGKMNAAGKPRTFQEAIDFIIMGHVHDLVLNKENMVVRDTVDFKLKMHKQYVIVLPSFMGYFNTYGARKGYAPPADGMVVMELYADGDYHARS